MGVISGLGPSLWVLSREAKPMPKGNVSQPVKKVGKEKMMEMLYNIACNILTLVCKVVKREKRKRETRM